MSITTQDVLSTVIMSSIGVGFTLIHIAVYSLSPGLVVLPIFLTMLVTYIIAIKEYSVIDVEVHEESIASSYFYTDLKDVSHSIDVNDFSSSFINCNRWISSQLTSMENIQNFQGTVVSSRRKKFSSFRRHKESINSSGISVGGSRSPNIVKMGTSDVPFLSNVSYDENNKSRSSLSESDEDFASSMKINKSTSSSIRISSLRKSAYSTSVQKTVVLSAMPSVAEDISTTNNCTSTPRKVVSCSKRLANSSSSIYATRRGHLVQSVSTIFSLSSVIDNLKTSSDSDEQSSLIHGGASLVTAAASVVERSRMRRDLRLLSQKYQLLTAKNF